MLLLLLHRPETTAMVEAPPLGKSMLSHPTHHQMPTYLKVCCSHGPPPTDNEHLNPAETVLEPPGGEGLKGSSPLAAIKSRNYGNPYVGLCYILSASFTLVTFKGQTKKNQKRHWTIFIQDSTTKITAISLI